MDLDTLFEKTLDGELELTTVLNQVNEYGRIVAIFQPRSTKKVQVVDCTDLPKATRIVKKIVQNTYVCPHCLTKVPTARGLKIHISRLHKAKNANQVTK